MNFFADRKNQTITIVCLLIAAICIYLIQNDSIFRMIGSASTVAIGGFEKVKKDVRKKKAATYFWEDLTRQDVLSNGDSIFTGPESSVTVKLKGGQRVVVAPNSLIKFRTKNKKLVIDIPYGTVQLNNVVEGLVISDCGQDIDLAQGSDSIKLAKSEECGSVSVDTESVQVNEDFKTRKVTQVKKPVKETFLEVARTGVLAKPTPTPVPVVVVTPEPIAEAVPEPTPQPIEPVLSKVLPPIFKSLDVKFMASKGKKPVLKWAPVDTAESYEIEISDTIDFAKVKKFESLTPEITVSDVNSSVFFRGKTLRDEDDFSDFSETGKIQIEFPKIKVDQPLLSKDYMAKNPKDLGGKQSFDVSWSEIPLAEEYVVELKDPVSSEIIKKFTSRSPASVIEVPRTGKYAYQVHALDAKGRKISSSDTGEVSYNKIFSAIAPVIRLTMAEKFYFFQKDSAKYVWLSWIHQGPEQKFRVEIAKDKEFKEIIKSVFTAKKKLLVTDKVEEGDYFWRVRSEEKEQYSDWSNTEIFKVKVNQNGN